MGGRGLRDRAGLWALPELRILQACFDTSCSEEGVIIFSKGFLTYPERIPSQHGGQSPLSAKQTPLTLDVPGYFCAWPQLRQQLLLGVCCRWAVRGQTTTQMTAIPGRLNGDDGEAEEVKEMPLDVAECFTLQPDAP